MSGSSGSETFHTRKVSRLPPLADKLDPINDKLFAETRARGGTPLNLHLTSGHAPRLQHAKRPYSMALRNACDSPRKLRELAILLAATIVDCAYELDHHIPLGRKAGLSDAQLEALKNWKESVNLFDDKERAVLGYVDEMCRHKGVVADATFAALQKQFTSQEIVEITANAATYYGNGLFIKALAIVVDDPHVKATPGKF